MLKPETMSKLFIVGPKSRLEKIVSKLHELKIAHIIEHKKDEFDLCSPLSSFEKVSNLLVQVRSLTSHIKTSETMSKVEGLKISDLDIQIPLIKREVSQILEEIKKTEEEAAKISEQKKILRMMSLLLVSPENFKKSNYIKHYLGYVKDPDITKKLENVTDRFEINTAKEGKNNLVAIFADKNYAESFDKMLADASFSEIDSNLTNEFEGNSDEIINQLSKKQELLENHLSSKNSKFEKTIKKHSDFLINAERLLSIEAEKSQIPLSFGSTREAFFLSCFVPKADLEKVKSEVNKASSGKAHMAEQELGSEEDIPVKLNNKSYIKNFEFFTNLYSLPKYNEFDPSILMAFTFPLFFGFMLGDVGYGLITFALFYFLKKKIPAGKQFFNILMASSVSAIIFGIFYGEVFGFEPWHGLIVRTHDFMPLMYISIIAGIVQINFGYILGFINEYKHHGILKAVYAKLSWILLQIIIAVIVLVISPLNLSFLSKFIISILLLIPPIFMIYKGEGGLGLVEIISLISHTASYARLMAVGLASVFIAVMVNDLTTFLLHKGILFIPLALVALITGHLFNIALGILSPSLHSIRLHYVEFFTKFYKGGGIEYTPFGAEKQKSLF